MPAKKPLSESSPVPVISSLCAITAPFVGNIGAPTVARSFATARADADRFFGHCQRSNFTHCCVISNQDFSASTTCSLSRCPRYATRQAAEQNRSFVGCPQFRQRFNELIAIPSVSAVTSRPMAYLRIRQQWRAYHRSLVPLATIDNRA